MLRLIAAFVVAPPVAVLPVFLFVWLVVWQRETLGLFDVVMTAGGVSLVGYGAEALIGLPGLVLLRRRNRLNWWNFVIGGLLCSVAATCVLLLFFSQPIARGLSFSYHIAAVGGLAGILFWFIGVFGNSALTAECSGRSRASVADSGR
jgi:hypothetical protein